LLSAALIGTTLEYHFIKTWDKCLLYMQHHGYRGQLVPIAGIILFSLLPKANNKKSRDKKTT